MAEPHDNGLMLREHRYGRVNRRMPIGPVRWPFHDLFWVHEGAVRIAFPEQAATLDLVAPAGLLIRPGTLFRGTTLGAFATASICHFEHGEPTGPGWLLPRAGETLHIQNMLKLAMELGRQDRPEDLPRRKRLLLALLDCFVEAPVAVDRATDGRLDQAWRQAGQNLHRMRTLSDVAALLGLTESTLRALHRQTWNNSAGDHLRELRLSRAEELIVGTDKTLDEIARAVGYRHAATLSTAFRERRGKTPREYRRWANPFA